MAERLSTAMIHALLDKIATDFTDGVIRIYSGTQPADADAAETGDMLCEITLNDGAFSGGSPTNGITLERTGEALGIASGETWKGEAALTGTAGWFRFYANDYDTGLDDGDPSYSYMRFDGRVATSGAEMNLNTTSLVAGGPVEITSFSFTIPDGS